MAPAAMFCGPGTTHKNVAWANDFARDFGGHPHVAFITQHEYPCQSGRVATNIVAACDKLLSTALAGVYESFSDKFVLTAASNGLPFRLEEANSFSNGGAAGVSDAFASALWGLDYMYWWASHGASGINFHTGGYAAGAKPREPMKYAVFWNSPKGFFVHPLGYAIHAFDLGSHGQLIPTALKSNSSGLNLTAYGVLASDKSVYVTLINKEHVPGIGRDADVTIAMGNSAAHGHVIYLAASEGNVAATSGVASGGAQLNDDGTWNGTWKALSEVSLDGRFRLSIPAASAAIARFSLD